MITQPVTSNPAILAVLAFWDPRINPPPNAEHPRDNTGWAKVRMEQAQERPSRTAARRNPDRLERVKAMGADELRELRRQCGTWSNAAGPLGCSREFLARHARSLGIDTAFTTPRTDEEVLDAWRRAGSMKGAADLLGMVRSGPFYERVRKLVAAARPQPAPAP